MLSNDSMTEDREQGRRRRSAHTLKSEINGSFELTCDRLTDPCRLLDLLATDFLERSTEQITSTRQTRLLGELLCVVRRA